MVQAPAKPIALEAFLALPETKPANEYIDGQIIQKPMLQGKHSTIQRDLTLAVEMVLTPRALGRAFPELRCTFGNRSIVPDVAVFRQDNIPRESDGTIANQFLLPPDWVIEILSPDQSQTKVTKKLLHCLTHGSEMGWLIDPDEQTVFVYNTDFSVQAFDIDTRAKRLPAPAFAIEVKLTVEDMVNWLLA
ncbi:Uma2 family endonuclease [Leptolyngbya cf. ectocarpi LEGE 11479]|uniref:Uma2 family endonuclease n=1 Tax=Leptolyngbya cf. ectocarpi LEGE 11479 TaxID=1828722 RepID=A0A928ZYW3_LEPEC|nr:Uma2 family endonuclease [Leptolyngbya ectocarpi]MBE9069961.1 Uma2 family endonuclease [Leptolyngbya cf. ectocarpi LEGE 11479]